jgi:hypothetical protein
MGIIKFSMLHVNVLYHINTQKMKTEHNFKNTFLPSDVTGGGSGPIFSKLITTPL